jgi:hydrogenase maturation protease
VTGAGVLVVGYGNSLRGDDGVGWHAAGRLAADPRLAGARVLARHQLTPELAVDVAQASLVVLVDAVAGAEPREILVRRVRPRPARAGHLVAPPRPGDPGRPGRGAVRRGAPVVLVGVGAGSLATGDRLSDALERALPELVEVVLAVVGGGRRPPPHPPSV